MLPFIAVATIDAINAARSSGAWKQVLLSTLG
jgi:hypothetical protein